MAGPASQYLSFGKKKEGPIVMISSIMKNALCIIHLLEEGQYGVRLQLFLYLIHVCWKHVLAI